MIARRRTDVLWRRSGGRVLVLAPGTEEPLSLSGLAAGMWSVLEEGVPTDDLAEDISAALEVPILQAEETVSKLLDELETLGVVTCSPTT